MSLLGRKNHFSHFDRKDSKSSADCMHKAYISLPATLQGCLNLEKYLVFSPIVLCYLEEEFEWLVLVEDRTVAAQYRLR